MEYHSTKELSIDRSLGGVRVRISNVKGALTKDQVITAYVFKDDGHSEGDIWRQFFKMLDEGQIKSQQGAVLHCDKKLGWYLDVLSGFPKNICFDSINTRDGKIYFKYRNTSYQNGITLNGKASYRMVCYPINIFPEDCDTFEKKAWYLKNNLLTTISTSGYVMFMYQMDVFEKVPVISRPLMKGMPADIQVTNVCSKDRTVTVKIYLRNEKRTISVSIHLPEDIPVTYYKTVYSFYIAKILETKSVLVPEGIIKYDKIQQCYVLTPATETSTKILEGSPALSIEPKPIVTLESKTPQVIVDPASYEAKILIGKKVFASNSYNMMNCTVGILEAVSNEGFKVKVATAVQCEEIIVPFIKEAPKPKIDCYDFEDSQTRKNLFGRIYRRGHEEEGMIVSFIRVNDRWLANGKITAYKLMSEYTWIDGSSCGIEKEESNWNG